MKQDIIKIDLKGVKCYLCRANDNFILIDTGGYTVLDKKLTNRRELLQQELEKAGYNSENLMLVILTHGDIDRW